MKQPPQLIILAWAVAQAAAWSFSPCHAQYAVSAGSSADLDQHRAAYPYSAPPGKSPGQIVGMGIAGSNDYVYAWFADGTVSAGSSGDLDLYRAPYRYELPPNKAPEDIVGMGIAGSNDWVYAWYRDGTVSSGSSRDLDQHRAPSAYTLPPGRSPDDISGIGITGSNDRVYAWYRDGTVSIGTSRDLDRYSAPYAYAMAPGYAPTDILGMGIAGTNDRVYVWKQFLNVTIDDVGPGPGSTAAPGSSLSGMILSVTASGQQGAVGPATSWLSNNGGVVVEHLAAADPEGRLILFYAYPEAEWKAVDITEKTGKRIAIVRPESWLFPFADQRHERLAAPSPQGDLLVFSWHSSHDWEAENVSASTGKRIQGAVASWVTPKGDDHIEYLTARGTDDHLLVFYRPTNGRWGVVDLSAQTGQPVGGAAHAWTGGAGVGRRENVAVPSPRGDLLLFSRTPLTSWVATNITNATRQRIDSRPVGWIEPMLESNRIAARSPSGDLLVFWENPIENRWAVTNVSGITGRRVAGGSTSWLTEVGGGWVEHLAAPGPNDELLSFYKVTGDSWKAVDVTALTGKQVTHPPTSWVTGEGAKAVEHLAAPAPDRHMTEFAWHTKTNWETRDVSRIASGRVLYGGTTRAGLWRSRDYGRFWEQPVRPQPAVGADPAGTLDVPTVLDVAVSPADPDVVIAGTGRDHRTSSRTGIYRSTDGGDSWSLVHQFDTCGTPEQVTQVVFAPDDPSLAYAAGGCGIAVSSDGGKGWNEYFPQGTSGASRVWHLAVGADAPAGRRVVAAGPGRIWYSADGGKNWLPDQGVSGGVPAAFGGASSKGAGTGARVLAFEPGTDDRVYLAGGNVAANMPPCYFYDTRPDGTPCNAGLGVLWYGDLSAFDPRTDSTLSGTWTRIPGPPIYNGAGASGVHYVYTHAAADGYLLFFSNQSTVNVSVGRPTGASSWHRLDGWNGSESKRNNAKNKSFVHVDPHGLAVSPDFDLTLKAVTDLSAPYNQNAELDECLGGRLWLANDGGVYRSEDCGQTWAPAEAGLNNQHAINIAGVARVTEDNVGANPPPALYFGTTHNDDFYSMDGGRTWTSPASRNCGDCDAWYADVAQPSPVLRLAPRNGEFLAYKDANRPPDAGGSAQFIVDFPEGAWDGRMTRPYVVSWRTIEGYRPLIQTLATELPPENGDVILLRRRQAVDASGSPRVDARNNPVFEAPELLRARDSFNTVGNDPWAVEAQSLPASVQWVQAAGGHGNPTYYVGDGRNLWISRRDARGNVDRWDQIVPGGDATANERASVAVRFFVNPYDAGEVYIVDADFIRHSTDGGRSWPVDAALDDALSGGNVFRRDCRACVTISNYDVDEFILNDMIFDRAAPDTRFALGLAGVFYSGDGSKWFRLLDTRALPSIPRAAWFDRITDPRDRSLYVAFHGRGILRIHPIPAAPPTLP